MQLLEIQIQTPEHSTGTGQIEYHFCCTSSILKGVRGQCMLQVTTIIRMDIRTRTAHPEKNKKGRIKLTAEKLHSATCEIDYTRISKHKNCDY